MRRRTTTPTAGAARAIGRTGLAVILLLGLSACSQAGPRRDDGGQSGTVAGYADRLQDAGVELVSPGEPMLVQRAEAVAALQDAGIDRVASETRGVLDQDALALDPDRVAGLVDLLAPARGLEQVDQDTAGSAEGYVVLLFDEPVSAAVYAAADPETFSDPDAEERKQGFLVGSVVGYVAGGAGQETQRGVRDALVALAGPPTLELGGRNRTTDAP